MFSTKKIISGVAAISILLMLAFPAFAFSDGAASSVLYEPETGTFIYEKKADERRLIASTTKIMTALVIIENCDADETVTVPKKAESVIGTSLHLRGGQQYTVMELLYGILLESANDAAYTLAIHCAGSVEAFADMMNERAASIGMTNTHFENPHGLDGKEHYSTARDMALLAAEALKNQTFSIICSTMTAKVMGRTFSNHNKLLWSVDGLIGVKNGYTNNAGRTLVTACTRNGMTLIFVTLNDESDYRDHAAAYNWGFKEYKVFRTADEGKACAWLQVVSGDRGKVGIVATSEAAFLLKPEEDITEEIYLPKFVHAPINAGDLVGTVIYRKDGVEIFRSYLVFGSGAKVSPLKKPSIFNRMFDYYLW